jgi:exopolysaccharide biosynthesis polyprenyl glycosylphosphotransferase
MALGVFLSAAAWDTVLERLTRRRVLVIGDSAMEDIVAAASRDPRGRFEVVAATTYDAGGMPAPSDAALSGLAAVVEAQHPDYIVLADEQSCSDAVERLLDMTDRRFRVAGLTSFFEHVFGCVPLGHMTPMWFLSLLHVRQRMRCRPVKRLLDVVVAAVGLVCAAPIMLVLALFIKRTPGPVLYHQTRLGEAGRRFRIHKLRSMGVAAERPGEPVYAQQDDPRVTGVGRLMRRTHLDELPQLWNVLRGDMSLVGPRPERPEFVEMLEGEVPYWSRRLLVRPGMTGWAQVRCGYATDSATSAEKLSYDFWYMRHSNLAVDLAVCVRTLMQMLEILDLRARRLRRAQAGDAAR